MAVIDLSLLRDEIHPDWYRSQEAQIELQAFGETLNAMGTACCRHRSGLRCELPGQTQ